MCSSVCVYYKQWTHFDILGKDWSCNFHIHRPKEDQFEEACQLDAAVVESLCYGHCLRLGARLTPLLLLLPSSLYHLHHHIVLEPSK